MKHFITLILLIIPAIGAYCYRSAYLVMIPDSYEEQLIDDGEEFGLPELFLIASGAERQTMPIYLDGYAMIEETLTVGLEKSEGFELAEAIFERMHAELLYIFDDMAFQMTSTLRSGNYNCLSASMVYLSLLDGAGVDANLVVLPNHVYVRVYDGDDYIDVETTLTDGWNIAGNEYALQSYQNISGREYDPDSEYYQETDEIGAAAVLYASRSLDEFLSGNEDIAYQNALKAISLNTNIHVVVSNTVAAVVSYSASLYDMGFPIEAMLVVEDAVSNISGVKFLENYYRETLPVAVETMRTMGYDGAADIFMTRASNLISF